MSENKEKKNKEENKIRSIKAIDLKKMIINGARLIEKNAERVDVLNVFPVPDGDTGTNMSLTMQSCAKELLSADSNTISDVCESAANGALRGARGNSGVILSQIIKGFCSALGGCKEITTKSLAKAFAHGTAMAYTAVTKPQEGTILTVLRAMNENAQQIANKNISIDEFFKLVIVAGEIMLQRTPEMLPILKKAGVIDAGGRGLIIIFTGFYAALTAKDIEIYANDKIYGAQAEYSTEPHLEALNLEDIEFAYCTEFFIVNLKKKTTESDVDRLRQSLTTIGDSVLCVGDLSLVKVHVHTNEPGTALTYALELGEIDKVKIDNMLEQNRELIKKRKEPLEAYGLVSICAGEGLKSIFLDLGATAVVEGGQTMNPSASDIADACDNVKAETVFVFPNNKNIILAAEQAKALSKRNIQVIPAKSVPQGISAILAFDFEAKIEDNLAAMQSAVGEIKSGAVTYAVRSTKIDNFDLKEGDIIGMEQSNILVKGKKVSDVTEQLIDKMMTPDTASISLYFGSNVKEKDANLVKEKIAEKYSFCEVDIYFGGQPLYYYIVSLE